MTAIPPASPHAGAETASERAQRVVEALIAGLSLETISAEEGVAPEGLAAIVHDQLNRRWIAPAGHFAKIQVARLESLSVCVLDRAQSGNLAAVDRALKIIDRLDRYHGFSRANPMVEPYGEEERERLLAKINAIVERMRAEGDEG